MMFDGTEVQESKGNGENYISENYFQNTEVYSLDLPRMANESSIPEFYSVKYFGENKPHAQ